MKIRFYLLYWFSSVSILINAQSVNFEWAKQFSGGSFDYGNSIALDITGNVYTTGGFQGTVDFDPGTGTSYLSSSGYPDIFISKLGA
jgi:hypothetical protein